MTLQSEALLDIRKSVKQLCDKFGEDYWQKLDEDNSYPTDFVIELTQAGFLGCLIPEEYGGSQLGLKEACAILEEVSRSGGHPGACHAQMYVMGTILQHGSAQQKGNYLPSIASGEIRLQSFAVTEPNSGTNTTALKTSAKRVGDHFKINGQKVWISRVEHSDLMILLARTTPIEKVTKKNRWHFCFYC